MMKYKKVLCGIVLAVAVVAVAAIAFHYINSKNKAQNESWATFILDTNELPLTQDERMVRYVSADGTLSDNPDESVGTVEMWLE